MMLSCIDEIPKTHDECPACDGRGEIPMDRQVDVDVFVEDDPMFCHNCNGTGFVKMENAQ